MTDYNDGKWHVWNGGECPVHPESVVEMVWPSNFGDKAFREIRSASGFSWRVGGDSTPFVFRVTKPFHEPRVIWVNEYPEENMAHQTEDAARRLATPHATRIAVRYVEAPE